MFTWRKGQYSHRLPRHHLLVRADGGGGGYWNHLFINVEMDIVHIFWCVQLVKYFYPTFN